MNRRLFFGLSVEAPWPDSYPKGRVIDEAYRHITLAFLGNGEEPRSTQMPLPDFPFGPTGFCDQVLFLPELAPRVAAYHVSWKTGGEEISTYLQIFFDWLEKQGYKLNKRPFLPHVTMARSPFDEATWETHFTPLPIIVTGLHLYQSIGDLRYSTLFSHSFSPAFEEFEHTADLAYIVRGKTLTELYIHAAMAMGFTHPPILSYFEKAEIFSLDHIVQKLNQMIASCDREMGCPFKAVSYHGNLREKNGCTTWEMIVDV